MAPAKKFVIKRTASKKKPARKQLLRKAPRKQIPNSQFAATKETYTISSMTSNDMMFDLEQNIGDYPRAKALAQYYQFYRIKYIKYKFMPRYNNYPATTTEAGANPIPYLHYQIDKNGSLPTNTTIGMLKAMGTRPHKFIQPVIVAWKPGVTTAISNSDATVLQANKALISPWLMTNKTAGSAGFVINDADHKGLYWCLETLGGLPGDGTYEYDAEVEVAFEFKKPSYPISANVGVPATSVHSLPQTQVSREGIVIPAQVL